MGIGRIDNFHLIRKFAWIVIDEPMSDICKYERAVEILLVLSLYKLTVIGMMALE